MPGRTPTIRKATRGGGGVEGLSYIILGPLHQQVAPPSLPGTIVGGVVPVHAGGPTGDGAGDYHPHSLDRWASGSNYSAGARGPIDSRALGLGCLCPTAGPPSAPG